MASEYGPFNSEREALATRAAARIRAAFDAAPGVGASVPESLAVMTEACAECGVEPGSWDLGFLRGVAWGETANAVSLAGIIRRAFEAGKTAAMEGAETGWGVRFTAADGHVHVAPESDEETARNRARTSLLAGEPGWALRVVRHEVTPWREVPDA